jgi:hypothetical protein
VYHWCLILHETLAVLRSNISIRPVQSENGTDMFEVNNADFIFYIISGFKTVQHHPNSFYMDTGGIFPE